MQRAPASQRRHVEQALSLVQDPASLDIPIGQDGDTTLGDLLEAPDAEQSAHGGRGLRAQRLRGRGRSRELKPREERILRMRFGIGMAEHTLEQVSKPFEVTRERIRQIEAKALQKLGHTAWTGKLLSFTES